MSLSVPAYILGMLSLLKECAKTSNVVSSKHASALIFSKNNYLMYSNIHRSYIDGNVINTLHAEANCLQKLLKLRNKNKCLSNNSVCKTIIVIKLANGNTLGNSKPCINCLNKLKKLNIKRIFYSDKNGNIVGEKIKNMISGIITEGDKHVNKLFHFASLNEKVSINK
jgi:deoxycytidylate deaminase